jgi:hypothetical protein
MRTTSKKPARTKPEVKKVEAAPPPKPEPSEAERKAISRATVRLSERPRRVALRTETIKGKLAEIGPSHSDHVGWLARLQNAFGTTG